MALNLYRFTTEWLRGIRRRPGQVWARRGRWTCPVCEFTGRFIDAGSRPEARCPNCGSRERDRVIALYWRRTPWDLGRARILHFSPEAALWPRLRRAPGYVSSDVVRHKRAGQVIDIRAIPYADGHFDHVICNHVLEHVVEHRAAMAECFRVLAPGGCALFSVPIEPGQAATWDPPPGMPAAEIARICGELHVRLYGQDFPDLLAAHGFAVREIAVAEADDARHRLRWPGVDRVFEATKPG